MLFLSTNQPANLLLLSLLSLLSLSNATVAVGRGAPASGPVYILGAPSSSGNGAAGVARVGSALRTLGFPTTYLPFLADDNGITNATTYYDHYAAIVSREPGAKFILPADSSSPSESNWLRRLLSSPKEKQRTNGASLQPRSNTNGNDAHPHTLALRALFSQPAHSQQLLELRFDGNNEADSHQSNSVALPPSEQLQAWEQLCDFLGLGYSVVERLKLRRFP